MDVQVENAVEIASNPGASQDLKRQAMEFLQQVKESPDGWQVCLPLFVRSPQAGDIVRLFALEVTNTAIQHRYQHTDSHSLNYIKETLVEYMRNAYLKGSGMTDSPAIQNKLTQTLTYLFVYLYTNSWPTFFDDILSLTATKSNDNGQTTRDNLQGVVFFLRMVVSVHDEIADVQVPRSQEEQQRNGLIKDYARENAVRKLVVAWLEILDQWRGNNDEIVEMCLKVIGRWVSWIDISLVVNEVLMNLLFQFLAGEGRVRDAAITTLVEIVGKKMKAPDKLGLISFLRLGEVVGQLISSPGLQKQGQAGYDIELAEGTAKLVNGIGADLLMIMDRNDVDQLSKQGADNLMQTFFPYILRFFSDEYDEVSVEVFPCVFDLLALLRKEKKALGGVPQSHAAMLQPLLNAIVMKAKYDETTTWGDEDEQTDEAEFQELRKKLKTFQDQIATIDEGLYIEAVSELVGNIFDRVSQGGVAAVGWREIDLALYEMYIFGELATKNGGIYSKGVANGVAAERLIGMITKMMNSDVTSSSHPAIKLRYMEIVVRYSGFFEVQTGLIPQALDSFVKAVHDGHIRVRTRSWYQFQRFVKTLRGHIGDYIENVLEAISDLLVIKAELPSEADDAEDMSSDEAQREISTFESQLYLFEAVGCLASTNSVHREKQAFFARSVMNPIFVDLEKNMHAAKSGDARSVLQIHHDIMALGTLAKGFSEWAPGTTSTGTPPSELVSEEFKQAAEAILFSLESLSRFPALREAGRHSFSRLIGVLGSKILPMLLRWINGLLSESSTKEEMSVFLRLLDQVVHGFKTEIFDILNSLFTPLLTRIFTSLGEATSGTDDEIQLADLRREYLSFLLVILNNDLGGVFVSEANQGIFEQVLNTVEHYAKDTSDPTTGKLAFNLLTKMSIVWGPATTAATNANGSTEQQSKQQANGVYTPKEQPLPGFEKLMIERFSLLCWEVPAAPGFSVKDAQAKLVLGEVAGLQKTLYTKLGDDYLQFLQSVYFPRIGLSHSPAEEYLTALKQMDLRGFRNFFQVG
ncbi:pre-tRNA nuclear export protein [Rhizina undulata]